MGVNNYLTPKKITNPPKPVKGHLDICEIIRRPQVSFCAFHVTKAYLEYKSLIEDGV